MMSLKHTCAHTGGFEHVSEHYRRYTAVFYDHVLADVLYGLFLMLTKSCLRGSIEGPSLVSERLFREPNMVFLWHHFNEPFMALFILTGESQC